VMIGMIMLGSLSLAREREGGTWEALLALPLRPVEALVGKLLPYAVIGTLQGILVLGIGIAAFDLPTRGNVVALIALLPLFTLAHLTLGYAIAARAATQLAALQGAVAFYLPAMLLSGFLYPFATLPRWAQVLGDVFPLTHFIRAARGALLRDDNAVVVLTHAWPIAAFLLVTGGAAWALQARRLD
jgi:ABC-2 type transport system permease protein